MPRDPAVQTGAHLKGAASGAMGSAPPPPGAGSSRKGEG
jgi:hypothetical protein